MCAAEDVPSYTQATRVSPTRHIGAPLPAPQMPSLFVENDPMELYMARTVRASPSPERFASPRRTYRSEVPDDRPERLMMSPRRHYLAQHASPERNKRDARQSSPERQNRFASPERRVAPERYMSPTRKVRESMMQEAPGAAPPNNVNQFDPFDHLYVPTPRDAAQHQSHSGLARHPSPVRSHRALAVSKASWQTTSCNEPHAQWHHTKDLYGN